METITEGKLTFVLDKKPDFFKWLKRNFGMVDSFMSLKSKDKEKIFLRWKWGLADVTNIGLELSRQGLLRLFNGLEIKEVGVRWYADTILEFNRQCDAIKAQIGLSVSHLPKTSTNNQETTPDIAEALSQFDGKIED